ncbi:keratin, type I cytoskeletal 9 [Eutrema salsugineum]|uniref:keratin, type I cytoskeletal 9 n=1 Tax=Eutrema salsugineum TaxID=72664 RepID=UPI000CED6EBF|nr:keratin, type I cytoskeletal 9 [Eutrema salsugineum]
MVTLKLYSRFIQHNMEFKSGIIVLHLFLIILIQTQIRAVISLNQDSLSSVDQKRRHLTVETLSYFKRRELAGGGGSSGGGGSRGGSSGGSSGGGGSRGGSSGGSSGGGGSRGGGGGSRGSGGNKGGRGGGRGGDDGDNDSGGGSGGNSGPGTTTTTTTTQGGRFPNGGAHLQYSLVVFIFNICLVFLSFRF